MSEESASGITMDATISELVSLTSNISLSETVNNIDVKSDCKVEQKKSNKCIDELLLESFEFLQNKRRDNLDLNTLSSWTTYGERTLSFDENTKYADEAVVQKLYSAYTEYENLPERRSKKQIVNPLEMVKRAFLLNRSAIKLGNIESVMDYMFSDPVDKLNQSLINPNEIMYFVDIGGAPGGFADYLLWRRDWQTKGFGIPMKGCDYWNHKFTAGPQRFNIFKGAKRDGDVTNEENITSIVRYVKQHVSLGVHVVMADCAFDVKQRKYAKETIFKRMHLGEILLTLSLLRPNGHFIIKLFDVLRPFTVGLIYLMHKCFAEISLIKPKTSRPSSAERYLICKWKYVDTENVRLYLDQVNTKMNTMANEKIDVIHLVPEEIMLNNKAFHNFIYKSNNLIAESQVVAMNEMLQLTDDHVADSQDPSLIEKCLQQWNILPKIENISESTFDECFNIVYFPENFLSPLVPLGESFNLSGDKLGNEWHCIRIENVANDKRTLFARSNSIDVKMLDPITSEWIIVPDIGLEFPTNTLLYGEIVYHHSSNSDSTSPYGFHIIDGLFLNGQDIRSNPFSIRSDLCKKFANAINNPSLFVKNRNDKRIRSASVYCKETFLLKDLIPEMEHFRKSWKTTQDGSKVLGHNVQNFIGPKRFYQVNGLLFLRQFSKITDTTNFDETFKSRQIWRWSRPEILNTVDINKTPADLYVYLSHFCEFMNKTIGPGTLNWRDNNHRGMPSRYQNNRGRGRGQRGFRR